MPLNNREVISMADDPYLEPSPEEMEASGANDWLSETLAAQKRRDTKLKLSLNPETGSIRSKKNQLKDLLELPPEEDPEDPIPDLFADERAQFRKKDSELSSLMGELGRNRDADKDLLRDLFGK